MNSKLVDILQRLSINNITETNKKWVGFSCPLAEHSAAHGFKKDEHPSAGATLGEDGVYYWNCFCCGAKGTLSRLVTSLSKQRRVSYANILGELTIGRYYEDYDSISYKGTEVGKNLPIPDYVYEAVFEDLDNEANEYMTKRGITKETIDTLSIRYSSIRKRVIFPYINADQEIVGYSGRSILPNPKRKMLNSQFNKNTVLLGMHLWKGRPTVIVEGLFAYAKAYQVLHKDYDVAALSGTSLSEQQANILINKDMPVILFLDGDAPGVAATKVVSETIKENLLTYKVKYTDITDIDLLTNEEILAKVQDADKVI